MRKSLVIFGTSDIAQLAHYYFSTDSPYDVVGFCVDRAYLKAKMFCGLPVAPFEDVAIQYPPDKHEMFIALGYTRLNDLRKEKYLAAKARGYQLATYISSRATVFNDGNFGDNCFVLEDNTIQPFVAIGNNVTLWSGNHIGHHSRIGDHCFISSHVVVSGGVTMGEQCFIGVNASLRDHITIGSKCVIGAGALILKDTAPEGLYVGEATERAAKTSTSLRKI